MSSIYLEEAERVARQSFARWNREPASPSYGSFDRQYWGWKYKDFSDATLQYGVRLAVEYAVSHQLTDNLPPLLEGYVTYCESIQIADGSFNQCYPYERTPGVIYDILSTLIYVRQSPFLAEKSLVGRLDRVIAKAAGFALSTDEKHGEVANHLVEYAYELLNYAAAVGNDRAKVKADRYLDRFMGTFERDEGWFLEYNGPDPGYQTRSLRYLVKIADMTGNEDLWRTAEKAADFINEVLMPDGSIHPMLGCRSTALLYPSAFERLACRSDRWQGLAARVRDGWACRKVPMPSEIDYGNAIRLADDALDAHRHLMSNPVPWNDQVLPTDDKDFPVAGIHVRRAPKRMVFVGAHLGGVVVIYTKSPRSQWELAHEDSGYLIKSNQETWVSRMPGSGTVKLLDRGLVNIEAKFARSLHDEVTPIRLIALRILNLTVLRIQWLGDLFRKMIVRMLMNGTNDGPWILYRDIEIDEQGIRITDRLKDVRSSVGGEIVLLRCRRIIGVHMASSRYFQEAELKGLELPWADTVPWPGTADAVINMALNIPAGTQL